MSALEPLVALAPAAPAAGAAVIAAMILLRRGVSERAVVTVAHAALWLSALGVAAGAALARAPRDVPLGRWYRADDYGFDVVLRADPLSVAVGGCAAVLILATSRFSVNYLHREPGFRRFFLLMCMFAAGLQLAVFAGSLDLMLAGWEAVGMTSVLLVGFFHERAGPSRASLRLLVTYRLCDVGLLVAAVALHLSAHTTVFSRTHAPHGAAALVIALSLTLAAMGKSAQFPVGGWLPRAMEGPTASSAVFYGGLSVHLGVYLLVRAAPLFESAPAARLALVAIGLVTAVMGALSGQVSADAKTALAYATISQVGLMFVECGAGLDRLATLHLVAHATLRYYQFLRTPSTLQDALARRAALGGADMPTARHELLGPGARRFVYRLALERFEVEAALDRWVARPFLAAAGAIDAAERRLLGQPRRGGDA